MTGDRCYGFGRCRLPRVRAELLHRVEADQDVRRSNDGSAHSLEKWRQVDEDSTAWLKQIIDDHGWPGECLVGRDGADAAWLLAQHADRDPEFQERCLQLLEWACQRGEATRRHVAYLTDRVRVNAGRPQLYGTQYIDRQDGRGYQPQEIEDPEHVDQRRAAAGMEPFAEYDQLFRDAPSQTI